LKKAESLVKTKISAGIYHKNKYSESITTIDRYGPDEEAVFPASVPRVILQDIFNNELDWAKKVYESPDGKSLICYALAGHNIMIASLKSSSKFKSV